MRFRLTPQLIGELLSRHAGIATPEPLYVFAQRAPAFWELALFGPFAVLRGRPYMLALNDGAFVLLELTRGLNVGQVWHFHLAELETVVARKVLGGTQLILRLRGGEKLPLRVGNKVAGFPLQRSNLDTLLSALAERGLLQKSALHLKMLAVGLVFGLLVLGLLPLAIRYWFRTQTEAEREAIHRYLEVARDLRYAPGPLDYASADVLSTIETYQAPPMPRGPFSWLIDIPETYDARLRSGEPVPPNLSDTLVEDVKILLKHFFPDSSSPPSEAEVARALGLYLHVPWTSLPGYRPWTHWNFVRGLSELERNTLVRQVARRLKD